MTDGRSPGEAGGLPSAVNSVQFHVHPEGRLVTARRGFDSWQRLNISQYLFVVTADAVLVAVLRFGQHDMKS